MSETGQPKNPYEALGKQLKRMRIKHRESMAEVSGAVEIDVDTLSQIERGGVRPNEEILLLLMSHFNIKEDEADTLWKLAGYDDEAESENKPNQTVMVTPDDLRIVYTDMVHVVANNYGVVLNFMQTSGPGSQPLAISRVGMSREHAQSVLEVLRKTLANSKQAHILPAPKSTKESKEQ